MKKMKEILVEGSKKNKLPIAQCVRYGDLLFVSGQVSVDLYTGKPVSGTFKEEVKQTLENLKLVVEAAGASINTILKVTIFLTDMIYFDEMNEVYKDYFTSNRPARSCISVKLAKDFRIEIEAIAYIDNMK